jgi:hypothetical protein
MRCSLAKSSTLRKNGGIVVKRSICEVEYEAIDHEIAVHVLDQVTVGDGLALQCAPGEKTMHQAFLVMPRHLGCRQQADTQKWCAEHEHGQALQHAFQARR